MEAITVVCGELVLTERSFGVGTGRRRMRSQGRYTLGIINAEPAGAWRSRGDQPAGRAGAGLWNTGKGTSFGRRPPTAPEPDDELSSSTSTARWSTAIRSLKPPSAP